MTEIERLKQLLLSSDPIKERDLDDDWGDGELEEIADHLLSNGVIVPPVTIGQTVYSLENGISQVFKGEVYDMLIRRAGVVFRASRKGYFSIAFTAEKIGKTVFLTEEEAEKALAERSGRS